jgi:hypothetical protein
VTSSPLALWSGYRLVSRIAADHGRDPAVSTCLLGAIAVPKPTCVDPSNISTAT